MLSRAREETPRWLALIAIGAVALGSYAIAPAIGGPPKLTVKRAKVLFYTKTLSNSRYYTKAVADARFVPRQSGEHSVTLDPWEWREGAGAPTKQTQPGFVSFADDEADVVLELHAGSLPSQFAGKGLRLAAIEVCFELTDAEYDRLEVTRAGPIGGDPIPTPITFLVHDPDPNLTAPQCLRVDAPPAPVGGTAILDLELTVDFTAAGTFDIGRTTAIFVP
jgi:hypothetical protein